MNFRFDNEYEIEYEYEFSHWPCVGCWCWIIANLVRRIRGWIVQNCDKSTKFTLCYLYKVRINKRLRPTLDLALKPKKIVLKDYPYKYIEKHRKPKWPKVLKIRKESKLKLNLASESLLSETKLFKSIFHLKCFLNFIKVFYWLNL